MHIEIEGIYQGLETQIDMTEYVWAGVSGNTGAFTVTSLETLPSSLVTQPKRTFTTVRTPKDIASENSISRCVANLAEG